MISSLMIEITALATRHLTHTPIGRALGCLSRAIRRQATKGARISGETKDEQMHLANKAIAIHNSLEAEWKAVQSRLQQRASIPKVPAAPVVRRAAERITQPSKASNTKGWDTGGLPQLASVNRLFFRINRK